MWYTVWAGVRHSGPWQVILVPCLKRCKVFVWTTELKTYCEQIKCEVYLVTGFSPSWRLWLQNWLSARVPSRHFPRQRRFPLNRRSARWEGTQPDHNWSQISSSHQLKKVGGQRGSETLICHDGPFFKVGAGRLGERRGGGSVDGQPARATGLTAGWSRRWQQVMCTKTLVT